MRKFKLSFVREHYTQHIRAIKAKDLKSAKLKLRKREKRPITDIREEHPEAPCY